MRLTNVKLFLIVLYYIITAQETTPAPSTENILTSAQIAAQYPQLSQLTLSDDQYATLKEQNSVETQNTIFFNILLFTLAYLVIGTIAIIIEYVKGKALSISLMFLFLTLQSGLDIMDVSSDVLAANQLLTANRSLQCGWTQCTFPDIFSIYGQALFASIIIGGLTTIIAAFLILLQIIQRICCSSSADLDDESHKITKIDIFVTLFKLFFADLPALIIYMSLWNRSWQSRGITISGIAVISFAITCGDIVYALFMILFTLSHHELTLKQVFGDRCQCLQCPVRLLMCTLFVSVVVAVIIVIVQTTGDVYQNPVPRVSIGQTCYDPYTYPNAVVADDLNPTGTGTTTEKGVIFSDLVLLTLNISARNYTDNGVLLNVEEFEFDFFFLKDYDWEDATESHTGDHILFGIFAHAVIPIVMSMRTMEQHIGVLLLVFHIPLIIHMSIQLHFLESSL
eukprot:1104880_1